MSAPPSSTSSSVDAAADQLSKLSVDSAQQPQQPPQGKKPARAKVTLESIAEQIARGEIKRVVVLTGAGISCSAGIPDFRSPGTGLYDNLQKYNLPHPTAVFELDYFRRNPAPFFLLARELYPGVYRPTPTHHFLRVLDEQKLLLRCLTQNIDGLEGVAGLDPAKLVQAHGGFNKAHCIDCSATYPEAFVKDAVFAEPQRIPRCTRGSCGGKVKPAITFFGEGLPQEFALSVSRDLPQADLLVVMGTSLTVQPFASLITRVRSDCPRILINNEAVGVDDDEDEEEEDEEEEQGASGGGMSDEQKLQRNEQYRMLLKQRENIKDDRLKGHMDALLLMLRQRILSGASSGRNNSVGFNFRSGRRDVFLRSDCDSGVRQLAKLIGPQFASRLEELVEADRKAHPAKSAAAEGGGGEAAAAKAADSMAKVVAAAAKAPAAAEAEAPLAAAPSATSSANNVTVAAPAAPASSSSSSHSSSAAQPSFAIGFDFDHTLGFDHGLEIGALKLLAEDLGKTNRAEEPSWKTAMEHALKSFRDGHTTQQDLMRAFAKESGVEIIDDNGSSNSSSNSASIGKQHTVSSLQSSWHSHCFVLSSRTTPADGALDLLRWLRQEGIPVAILTNGWSPLQGKKVGVALGDLAPHPEALLVSDALGAVKPARAAFEALRRCPGFASLPPERVWYVGDNPSGDVGGALDAGLQAVWADVENVPYPQGQAKPAYTIHSMSELKPILEKHMQAHKQAQTPQITDAAKL